VFDPGSWHIASHGSGFGVFERNGRLELEAVADPVWDPDENGAETHYGTQCLMTGDFDARVEYELLDWPTRNGVSVTFGAYIRYGRDTTWAYIGRGGETANGPSYEGYGSEVALSKNSAQTADRAGTFRLRRIKGRLTAYYGNRGTWIPLASGYARGGANLILGMASRPENFGHQRAATAFDRFQATAETVSCKGYPVPPRRTRA
jgi:hypothetical protein